MEMTQDEYDKYSQEQDDLFQQYNDDLKKEQEAKKNYDHNCSQVLKLLIQKKIDKNKLKEYSEKMFQHKNKCAADDINSCNYCKSLFEEIFPDKDYDEVMGKTITLNRVQSSSKNKKKTSKKKKASKKKASKKKASKKKASKRKSLKRKSFKRKSIKRKTSKKNKKNKQNKIKSGSGLEELADMNITRSYQFNKYGKIPGVF